MPKFNPSPKTLVVNELIERGYTIDYDDALRICHELEEEQQTHHKAAIGLTAVGIVGAGVTLAFCGAVAPLLVPIAAIGVGMSGVWNHPIRATRRDDEADFLRANPSIVQLIEAKLQSGEAPFKVAAAYLECFRAWRNTGQPLALPTVGNVPTDESLPAAEIATSSQIGTATKLGAVDVASARTVHNVPSSDPSDIAESLAVNLQSTLIVGQPGSGKGVCIAMATRAVKKLHPDVKIWAIDPKADPSEAWYWEAVDHYLPVRIDPFADAESMTGIMEAIDDFIQQFQDSGGAKLLIFDEALAVKEKTGRWFKGLMAGFNALCSMGRSRRQYGWLVSQSPNTDDFGISGGVRNVYRRILLISADNLGLLDNGSTYFSGKPSTENLKQTGRAFFDSIINS